MRRAASDSGVEGRRAISTRVAPELRHGGEAQQLPDAPDRGQLGVLKQVKDLPDQRHAILWAARTQAAQDRLRDVAGQNVRLIGIIDVRNLLEKILPTAEPLKEPLAHD